VVCQCLSNIIIIIAAAKTGVISANKRMANKRPIVTKGSKCFLFLKPGIARVRLVINRLVNDIVELIPAKITDNIKIS
jgi:hypothetical protein